MRDARMVLGLSGWMDGGEVSTGVVQHIVDGLGARQFAEIEPQDFFIYNVPGPTELSVFFRPHVKIDDGLVVDYQPPRNTFYRSDEHRLVLFSGKEPNLRWDAYVDCILGLAAGCDVRTLYFIGSVAGLVPHTREPRLFASVSDASMKSALEPLGIRPSNYEGPGSIMTLLTRRCAERGLRMASIVAEIPAYIQGRHPRAVEAAVHALAALLGLPLGLDELRKASDDFEAKVSEMVEKRKDLATLISKLEEDYDNEVIGAEMGDLKDWLEQQGLRPD